jgi:hypothetical protein
MGASKKLTFSIPSDVVITNSEFLPSGQIVSYMIATTAITCFSRDIRTGYPFDQAIVVSWSMGDCERGGDELFV